MTPAQKRLLLGASLIFALTIAAYVPALRGGFIWDDDAYVTRNATLTAPGGLARIWTDTDATPQYYPLVFTTFWIERLLWGLHPVGYHVVNVLLHAAGAVLLWRILALLHIPGAGLTALIFALHPVHVESVAWITERKNVLSGVFYFAAMLVYLRGVSIAEPDPGAEVPGGRSSWKHYALALLFFCGALLSKSVTASLPAAIVLILWWKRDRLARRDVWPLLPFFTLGLAMGLTTAWLEQHHVGAERVQWGLTPLDRVLIAGRAVWFYLGKLLWPQPLIFTYPRWQIDARATWQYLFPVAALGLVSSLYVLRGRLGKGPLVAALFFGGTLLPALGFIDVYPMIFSYVADHFQYLASIGPIALISALAATSAKIKSPATRAIGTTCLLLPLGILTWRQGRTYRDVETLWRATLAKNDDAWMAHNNLGVVLYQTDRLDESVRHFGRAMELNPQNPAAYNGLADARIKQDRWDEAAALIDRAMGMDSTYPLSHYHLGLIAEHRNRPDEALGHYRRALELMPNLTEAHNDLAILLENRGDIDAALSHYVQAIDGFAASGNGMKEALVRFNLAALLESRRNTDEAVEHYRRAVELKPDYGEAHLRLANLLFKRRRIAEAASHYEQGVLQLPSHGQARYNYGVALTTLRRLDEAAKQFEEALRLQPDYVEARFGLARVLELRGMVENALRDYEAILRDHPDHAESRKRWTALNGGASPTSGPTSHPQKASVPLSDRH